MKIAIIGNPGSGKSTLSVKLQKMLNLPLYHLDQYYWKPGWQRPDREEFKKVHHALCDGKVGLPAVALREGWIIEGVATRLFEYRIKQADVVIFLDIPVYICFYRVFKRALTHFGRVYFSSPHECPERLPDFALLSYIWNFNRDKKPGIERLLRKYQDEKKIFIIQNNAELHEFIKKF